MSDHNSLAIFETFKIRRIYDEQKETWYFSVIDIIAALTDQEKAKGLKENKIPAKKGGVIAKNARIALEEKIGKSVITGENFLPNTNSK